MAVVKSVKMTFEVYFIDVTCFDHVWCSANKNYCSEYNYNKSYCL